jgi:predicted ABC-type ATPase
VAFEAGKIILERMNHLIQTDETFAIETTLSSKSYRGKFLEAIKKGYHVKLLFFWLPTVEMAVHRVAIRVSESGHNIPKEVIIRRYSRGIQNLFKIYIPLCNEWAVFDNSDGAPILIAQGVKSKIDIIQIENWNLFKEKSI